jgi:hypothetical protein
MKHIERERVPLECPNPKCSATGWVPINQLDRQMVCRECGTRFYMNRTGHELVIGERPRVFIDPLATTTVVISKPDLVERVFTRWDRLSYRVKTRIRIGLASVGAIALVAWVWIAYLRPGPKLGDDLNTRVTHVVKSIVNQAPEEILPIVLEGTEGDLKRWIQKVRPKTWPKKMPTYKMNRHILFQNLKAKQGCVEVRIDSRYNPLPEPEPAKPAEEGKAHDNKDEETEEENEVVTTKPAKPAEPPGPRPVVFKTYWSLDKERGWLLDATACLVN